MKKNLEFYAGEVTHEGIKDFVGDLGGVGELSEAWEAGAVTISRHKKSPVTRRAIRLTLALEAARLLLLQMGG